MGGRDTHTKRVLRYLAIGGGIVVLSMAVPMLPHQLIKTYLRQKRFEKARFLRDLKRLQHRKLIDMEMLPDGTVRMKLLKRGKEVTLKMDLEEMTIERPKRWDGVWRLVLFDIPSNKNKARDALRWKMKQLGFYQLQKSVFLFPPPLPIFVGTVSDPYVEPPAPPARRHGPSGVEGSSSPGSRARR